MSELREQQWQILHFNALGNPKLPYIIDANLSVNALESIEVDEFGDSLKAIFTGRSATLNIDGLDVFEIRSRQTSISPWLSIFCGESKSPGVKNSFINSQIRLIGLKQRLYEIPPLKKEYGKKSSDSAQWIQAYEIAREIINDLIISTFAGNVFIYNAANFVTTSVASQQLIVGGSSIGRLLDILASSCNAIWGVYPNREIYFKPRPFETLTLTEDQYTVVQFKEPTAEGVVNRIDFFVPVPNSKDFVQYTSVNQASIDKYGIRRRVTAVPAEYSIIKEIKSGISFEAVKNGPSSSIGTFFENRITGPGSATQSGSWLHGTLVPQADIKSLNDKKNFDNEAADYCQIFGDASVRTIPNNTYTSEFWMINNSGKKVGLFTMSAVILAMGMPTNYYNVGASENKAINLYIDTIVNVSSGPAAGVHEIKRLYEHHKSFSENLITGELEILFGYYPTYTADQYTDEIVRLRGITTGGSVTDNPIHFLAVSEFRPFEFDSEFLERFAQTLFKDPPEDPATIKIYEQIILPKQIIEINSIYGLLTKRAKLFRYKFTSADEYGTTEIELEQAYNAKDTAQASVTKDRDTNALALGNQFTLAAVRNQDTEISSVDVLEYHETLISWGYTGLNTLHQLGVLSGLSIGKKYFITVGSIRHNCSNGNTSGVSLRVLSGLTIKKLCHVVPIAGNYIQDISGAGQIFSNSTDIYLELRAENNNGSAFINGVELNNGQVIISAQEIKG